MKRNNLLRFIEKEDHWAKIEGPGKLQEKIMNYIDRNVYKKLFLLKVFKYSAVSLFSISLVLTAVIFVNGTKPTKMVFIYPHSNNIENIEIQGNFHNSNENVPMTLDEERGVWTATIQTHKKEIDDYVINVSEKDNASDQDVVPVNDTPDEENI
jgi:hypothetical protein